MRNFSYAAPESVEAAIASLGSDPESMIMAGGVDLVHEMKRGIRTPSLVVDVKKVRGLDETSLSNGGIRVGACVTLHELERDSKVSEHAPLLIAAVREVATPQLRAMGTIAGNILQRPQCWYYRDKESFCLRKGGEYCHAVGGDNRYHAILGGGPCHIVCPSDLAPALMALGATVEVVNASGTRTLSLDELFVGPRVDAHNEHSLSRGDIVTAVFIPAREANAVSVFLKARERSAWDFSLASVALELCTDADGSVVSGTLALGGVAPNPWDATDALSGLVGSVPGPREIDAVAERALASARPLKQNAYKIDIARGLIGRALREALGVD